MYHLFGGRTRAQLFSFVQNPILAMSVADVAAAWLGYAVIAGACIVKVPQIYLMAT